MNSITQNKKIKAITESTLVVGIDVGSETHYAWAFDWRGIEYSKKPFAFSNNEAGFVTFNAWMTDIMEKHEKDAVIPGMEPTGHYWFNLGAYLQDNGIEGATLRSGLQKLIKEHDLPPVVFHSFRHSSVTYKLKLNGGDIKAVQGDTGHSQTSMVTDVYSHIIDDDRRKNAEAFEEAFYGRKDLNPSIHKEEKTNTPTMPEGVDPELIAKVFANPDMVALLTTLAKGMK